MATYAMHDELVSLTFRNLPVGHDMSLHEHVGIKLHYLNELYLTSSAHSRKLVLSDTSVDFCTNDSDPSEGQKMRLQYQDHSKLTSMDRI